MVSLESGEILSLLRLLSDEKQSLESAISSFNRVFSKNEHFKVGCGLCMLLQDQLLKKSQRFVAYFLICDLYRSESGINPFLIFFLDAIENELTDVTEKQFLVNLLFSVSFSKEVSRKNALEVISELERSEPQNIPDLAPLRKMYEEQAPAPRGLASIGIRPVVPAPIPEGPEGELLLRFRQDDATLGVTVSDGTVERDSGFGASQCNATLHSVLFDDPVNLLNRNEWNDVNYTEEAETLSYLSKLNFVSLQPTFISLPPPMMVLKRLLYVSS